ncbi:hypothetical protein O181_018531 [Austropuccinia psidii MF-1]|uniref:Reverse transcriptase Ty1/copia-type domain-containing protein n=1 Tax=Austropuccinia psidii MF-1 TaxID=1389203 RepID=A0A9Q3C5H3_9BASI|nr:hypothetical protein [Austropuccinia psidii MF-1]
MYWAEGVNTSAMLSNILPTPSRLNNSPYTLWTGLYPKIQRICTFGCRAIVTVLRNHRAWKLGATGSEEIFLGYKTRNTAYCVLCLSDSKILTTKHKLTLPKIPLLEIDESQPLPENRNAPSEPEDDPLEEEKPSTNSLPEFLPENPSRIRAIGPRHPTLVTSDINDINILPYKRRANTFVTSLGSTLRTFKAALDSLERAKWIKAIKKELLSMTQLNVLEMIELKRDYKLMPGINFERTYSPAGCLNSLHTLIAFAASEGLQFHQVDVKSAFLNAPLTKDVYLSIPQGLETDHRRYCLKLKKTIYGLKKAPLACYEHWKDWLVKIKFFSCVSDPCVFHRGDKSPTWIYIHVEDIAIFGHDVTVFKREISLQLNIKDSGPADLMLGIKINHFNDEISLDQQHFTESLIHLYGMTD